MHLVVVCVWVRVLGVVWGMGWCAWVLEDVGLEVGGGGCSCLMSWHTCVVGVCDVAF